jgi:uncharacterized membrane protein
VTNSFAPTALNPEGLRATLRSASGRLPVLARPALLGAATGLRSQLGMAAVLLAAGEGGRDRLPKRLQQPSAVRSTLLAAVGELIADKTARAGSRLAPGALATRLVLAGLAAAALAKVEGREVTVDVAIAVAAAAVAANIGHDLRAVIARKLPDRVVAFGEDAVAIALAALAVGGAA